VTRSAEFLADAGHDATAGSDAPAGFDEELSISGVAATGEDTTLAFAEVSSVCAARRFAATEADATVGFAKPCSQGSVPTGAADLGFGEAPSQWSPRRPEANIGGKPGGGFRISSSRADAAFRSPAAACASSAPKL
jgi:hypothetical protein